MNINRLNKHKKNNSKSKYFEEASLFSSSHNSILKHSNCCPKNPPNISNHYKEKKKNQVHYEYYNLKEKQNKYKQPCLQSSYGIYQRYQRNTHHQGLLVQKKSTNFVQSKSNIKMKSSNKQPIRLGKMKENKQKKNNLIHKEKKTQISRASFIPDDSHCDLQCFQTLAQKVNCVENYQKMSSINQSRNSIADTMIASKSTKIASGNQKKLLHFSKSPKMQSPKTKKQLQLQLIAEFQAKINQYAVQAEQQSLIYMERKDLEFSHLKNLNCYLDNQIYFDWKKRAVVIDWMMSVLAESGAKGKRQTFANSVNIFDRYLSATKNIILDKFQCIAASSMLIAAKLQDIQCFNAIYLSESTLLKYSPQEICQQQYEILSKLKFQVNTPTLNSWTNRLAFQWDMYLDNADLNFYDNIKNNLESIKFKNRDQKSYYNFRWLFQYIDLAILDIYTLRYQSRLLSLAFMYITLCLKLKLYTKDEIINHFPYTSEYLKKQNEFNQFFNRFLQESFNTSLFDLLPMIQYGATFVILSLKFELPQAVKQTQEEIDFEQFCSYQTRNQLNLGFLYKRNRNVF